MTNFKFKVGYTTDPDKIAPAITRGVIDSGDLIIVNDNGKGSFRFVLQDKSILEFDGAVKKEDVKEVLDEVLEEEVETIIEQKFTWKEE